MNRTNGIKSRRAHKRHKIQKEVNIYYRIGEVEKSHKAVIEEASASGMSISLPVIPEIPLKVKAELTLQTGEKLVIPSIVKWHSNTKSNTTIGIFYPRLGMEQIRLLNTFLKEIEGVDNLLSNRRKTERRSEVIALQLRDEKHTKLIQDLHRRMKQRVVVTGIGIVSPAGIGWSSFWERVCEGNSAIEQIKLKQLDGSQYTALAASIRDFSPEKYIGIKRIRKLYRSSQFAHVASSIALQDAGLSISSSQNIYGGVFLGTIVGGMERIFEQSEVSLTKGPKAMNPLIGVSGSWDEATSEISMQFHLNGPSHTICTGCASSTDAIGTGFRAIQRGELDFALVGGTDAPISTQIVNSYLNLGLLADETDDPKKALKPFDLKRSGFVLGEGATFLVIENADHARLRKANIYAEIVGYGNSCDAYHSTARDPLGNGLSLCISKALADADSHVSNVDYVSLHGTATKEGDRSEASALHQAFGNDINNPLFSCIKPIVGHMQGACGATEAAATILAMKHQLVPPMINMTTPDPKCNLNFVLDEAREKHIQTAISINSGFGGKNAVLVYKLPTT